MRTPVRLIGIAFTLTAAALLLLPAGAAAREWPSWLGRCSAAQLCGTFIVPLDRSNAGAGTIGLNVLVLPAVDEAKRQRDAITAIAGGPGGASTELASWTQATFFLAAQTRDIVLVDQRGTGKSKPLFCPTAGLVTSASSASQIRAYWTSCLGAVGVDPRLLTTAVAMDDLDDLRTALGYTQLNVYGGSYGATAAQYYLLRHGEHTRTVILDGGTLLDVPIFERYAAASQAMLDTLFARCTANEACRRAFPSPARDLRTILARLDRKPAEFKGATVTRDDFANAIQLLSRRPDTAAAMPLLLRIAARDGIAGAATAIRAPGSTGDQRPQVMQWAIRCMEPWARFDLSEARRLGANSYLGPTMIRSARYAGATCSTMPPFEDVFGADRRVPSPVPALVVVGGQDPQDPLANVAGITAVMPNARVVVVRGAGHGAVNHGCTERLADTFVQKGTAAGLDIRCAWKAPLTPFVLSLPAT